MDQNLTEKVQIRLPPELRRRLKFTAKAWSTPKVKLSDSDVVRALLEEHLLKEDPTP